jgi:hypothetical protein
MAVVSRPLPPSPSRACQGLPWHGATLIALAVQGPPYTARHRSRPLTWGRHPYEGGGGSGKKREKGPEKRLVFLADGHACFRLLGPLRIPPPRCGPPYPRRAYSSRGSSLVLGVYTWRPASCFLLGAPLRQCRWSRAHTVAGSSGQTQNRVAPRIKHGKRENIRLDQLL